MGVVVTLFTLQQHSHAEVQNQNRPLCMRKSTHTHTLSSPHPPMPHSLPLARTAPTSRPKSATPPKRNALSPASLIGAAVSLLSRGRPAQEVVKDGWGRWSPRRMPSWWAPARQEVGYMKSGEWMRRTRAGSSEGMWWTGKGHQHGHTRAVEVGPLATWGWGRATALVCSACSRKATTSAFATPHAKSARNHSFFACPTMWARVRIQPFFQHACRHPALEIALY
jgi:hypothetical protein